MIIDMNRRGFTIVELLVVITIMGALLILGIANLRGSQISARNSERKTDVETLALNLENYYLYGSDTGTAGRYPSTIISQSANLSNKSLEALVVGGGGGGGNDNGGGGGGGGVVHNSLTATIGQTYPVIVGDGGLPAQPGKNSSFAGITAFGGGNGGNVNSNGANGGSGGGGGGSNGTEHIGGNSTQDPLNLNDGINFGKTGGTGGKRTNGYAGGGGGGSGAAGKAYDYTATAGVKQFGGDGKQFTITNSGLPTAYAGGGGGGSDAYYGLGGSGGGGDGGQSAPFIAPKNGSTNTGGGGGGGTGSGGVGGSGGSGIVIISYHTGSIVATGGDTIIYTDSSNLNPVSTPTAGGYTIHIFNNSGTFTVSDVSVYDIKKSLQDLNISSITPPGENNPGLIAADCHGIVCDQTTTGVSPQPAVNQYVYQPLKNDGTLCDSETQECRKFNIFYRLEEDNNPEAVYVITSKNQ